MMRYGLLAFTAVMGVLLIPALSLAQGVEKVDGFVCPVFNQNSAVGAHNPNAVQIGGGDYTIIGPNVSVPAHATNQDGAGTPPGPHASPGDTDYSAIWGS